MIIKTQAKTIPTVKCLTVKNEPAYGTCRSYFLIFKKKKKGDYKCLSLRKARTWFHTSTQLLLRPSAGGSAQAGPLRTSIQPSDPDYYPKLINWLDHVGRRWPAAAEAVMRLTVFVDKCSAWNDLLRVCLASCDLHHTTTPYSNLFLNTRLLLTMRYTGYRGKYGQILKDVGVEMRTIMSQFYFILLLQHLKISLRILLYQSIHLFCSLSISASIVL